MSKEEHTCPPSSERHSFRSIGNPYQGYQEKRRRDALQRQKAARLHSANRARNLALDQDEQDSESQDGASMVDDGAEDTSMEASSAAVEGLSGTGFAARNYGTINRKKKKKPQRSQQRGAGGGVRAFGLQYGNELMQPEWLTDVPQDLAANWLVMPRPEGLRCLLVTSRGRTTSWLRNGAPLHRFHSALPGGSPATVSGGGGAAAAQAATGDYCIFDCVFHQPTATYYIQDLLCWRGYALYDCAAEFRAFWLASKLREEEGLAQALALAGPTAGPGQRPACDGAAAADDDDIVAATGSRTGQQAVDTEMGEGEGRPVEEPREGEQGTASVSYRIMPLPVHPATLEGLQAAYGSGHLQAPTCASAAATAAATAMAAAAFSTGPGPPPACSDTAGAASVAGAAGAALASWGAAGGGLDRGQAGVGPSGAGDVDFLRDGLYFLHRHGHYTPGLVATPLALLWKDLGCSRYLVDTDSQGVPLEHQLAVLAYRADRTVATEDEPPVVLGRLPEAFVAAMGDKLKPGRLLRFSIRQGGITFHEGRPAGADLHYEGFASQRRGRADTFSKILFQSMARTGPITIGELAAAARAVQTEAAAGAPGSDGGGVGGDARME